MKRFGLVLHGGAGVILKQEMTPDLESSCRSALRKAVDAGYSALVDGGSALDAVEASIRVMEDSPLFNAGHGAVLNSEGVCELDAAVMDGRILAAGAIAGVHTIKNPISLARSVMERSPHVFLIAGGAEAFAREIGAESVPNSYFQTSRRVQDLRRAKEIEKTNPTDAVRQTLQERAPEEKYGTVGCVALDQKGNLAAGTSTGGLTNKRFGRVGDSPLIGAGTYADNGTCAVSATGHGEYFIRAVVAHDIAARMKYQRVSLADAAASAIETVGGLGGSGGVIAIDRDGNIAMPFNTPGMYRGFRLSEGTGAIGLFGDDPVLP